MKNRYTISLFLAGFMMIQQLPAQEQTDGILQSQTFMTKDEFPKKLPQKASSTAATSLPLKMSYQGLLTTAGGAPVPDGAYDLTVDLYDSLATGNSQWTETHTGVAVQRGTFNITLGESTPLNLQFNKALFAEVVATGGPSGPSYPLTFAPRSELTSAPYSLAPWVTNGTNIYYKNGNIGMGSSAPESSGIGSLRLDIADEDGYNSDMAMRVASTGYPLLHLAKSRGTLSAKSSVVANDLLGVMAFDGHDGAFYRSSTGIATFADSTPGGGIVPGRIGFYTANAHNNWSAKMVLDRNGHLGIDAGLMNTGNLYPGLSIGGTGSGEGIASNRSAGGVNQWGLDLYTSYAARISISNAGNVGIGTRAPASRLHVHDSTNSINGARLTLTQAASGLSIFDGVAVISTNPSGYLWNYENGPLIFGTNNLERMRILATGEVGIGTNNPAYPLHVQTTNAGGAWINNASATGAATGMWSYAAGSGGSSHTAFYALGTGATTNYGSYSFASGGTASYGVYGSASGATTNYAGYFAGNLAYTGSLINASDAKLKENITDAEGTLARVMQLKARRFAYRSAKEYDQFGFSAGNQYGFVAQEVEQVFPELITTGIQPPERDQEGNPKGDPVEYKGIKTMEMIPILLKAIQEQQKRIDELQAKVARIENK